MDAENNQDQRGTQMKPVCRFPLGQIVATPDALDVLDRGSVNASELLRRHQTGDWGNVPPEDADENERSVANVLANSVELFRWNGSALGHHRSRP